MDTIIQLFERQQWWQRPLVAVLPLLLAALVLPVLKNRIAKTHDGSESAHGAAAKIRSTLALQAARGFTPKLIDLIQTFQRRHARSVVSP